MQEFYIKIVGGKVKKVKFKDEDSIKEAMKKLGYKYGIQLIDDQNRKHNNVDSFFGYSKNKKEMKRRNFVYLSINGPTYSFE